MTCNTISFVSQLIRKCFRWNFLDLLGDVCSLNMCFLLYLFWLLCCVMQCESSGLFLCATCYLHPGSGSQSAKDIGICDPSLYLYLTWKVHHNLCGSKQPFSNGSRLQQGLVKPDAVGSSLRWLECLLCQCYTSFRA